MALGVGIILAVMVSVTGTFGKQLLRFSALKKAAGQRKIAVVSLVGGIVLQFVGGPILDAISRMFAPQAVIAPFGGLQLVWNTILAPWTLNERITKPRVLGCVLITVALILFAFLSIGRTDPAITIENLEHRLFRPWPVAYFGGFLLWTVLNVYWLIPRPEGDRIRGLSLGLMGGTVAGNMICLKAALELLETAIAEQKWDVFLAPLTYTMIFGAAAFGIANAKLLTRGMGEYDTLFMSAVFSAAAIVGQCVSGGMVLGDYDGLSWEKFLLNVLGLFLIVLGVLILVLGEEKKSTRLQEIRDTVGKNKAADAASAGADKELDEDVTASEPASPAQSFAAAV